MTARLRLTVGLAAGVILGTLLPSTGARASGAPRDRVLHLSFLQDPGQPPDPDIYYAGQGLLLTRNLYEGLVQYQPGTSTRKIIPSLATSWAVSANGLTYTFQLRHGVLFHDGTPFTSAAIQPTFTRRAAVNGGPAYMVSDVASVQTPGPYSAVVSLKQPNSGFLDFLASAYGPVMESPTALAKYAGTDSDQTYLSTHDVGTGPYALTLAKVGVGYQMKAFSGYWGPKPYFTTIELPVIDNLSTQEIQFNDGQLAGILHDLNAPAVSSYRSNSAIKFYSLPTLESEEVYVNEHKGFLTSTAARVALLKAINVKSIDAGIFTGRASAPTQTSPAHLLPSTIAKQSISYDPSPLRSLVSKLSAGDRNLTIGYDTSAPDDQQIAETIGAQLQADGITTKTVGYQTSAIYSWPGSVPSAQTQAPNVLIDYFWPDADNAYTWSHITYDTGGGLQYLTCSVPGMDAADSSALTTGSLTIFNKVADLEQKSGCWLNIANRNDAMVFQPWVKGVAAAHVVAAPQSLLLSKLTAH
jgi:peptide/nickel transport system substrate-binding protein